VVGEKATAASHIKDDVQEEEGSCLRQSSTQEIQDGGWSAIYGACRQNHFYFCLLPLQFDQTQRHTLTLQQKLMHCSWQKYTLEAEC